MFSESTVNVLFQGDSITDAGRSRENDVAIGAGYPAFVSGIMGYQQPGKYAFINRGISGNRITDLIARVKYDIINLAPDVMSILIGINDCWHEFNCQNGVSAERFEMYYNLLIEEVKEALPDIKIMILEPFVMRGVGVGTEPYFDEFDKEVKLRAEKAKAISEKYNLTYIPLQEGLDKLSENIDPSYWTSDGVHPTPMGHEYIKNEWIKAFKAL